MDRSQQTPEFIRGIHRLAKLVVCLAFVVIIFGAKTKSKEAGLTMRPFSIDWNWAWFWVENLNAEYTHRVFVGLLSCFTLILTGWVFVKEKRRWVCNLALCATAVLIAQAVLGALTVHFLTRASTSIPHAVLGQTFLGLAVSLAVVTGQDWVSATPPVPDADGALLRTARFLVIALFVQLLLGAALRHDDRAEALREGRAYVFVWHLVAHFTGALAVAYFIARLIMNVFRNYREQSGLFKPTRLMMMLLAFQLALGVGAAALKVLYSSEEDANAPPASRVVVATTHLAAGAAILALSVAVLLRAYRFTAPAPRDSRAALGVPA